MSSLSSFAAGGFFNGSCTSQKNWVTEAKEKIAEIQGAIKALQEDPDCTGIATIIPQMNANLPEEKSSSIWAQSAKISQEMKDLHYMYSEGTPAFQTSVQNILAQKILDKEGKRNSSGQLLFSQPTNVANSLDNISQRSAVAANSALDGVSQFLNVLPNYRSCFAKRPKEGGIILSLIHI